MEDVHPIPMKNIKDIDEMEVVEACRFGNKEIFETNTSLLPRRIGRSGDTVLHLVCRLKQEELASFFIRLQPDLAKVTNDKEETPLHVASRVGALEIVKELLKACPSAAYMLNRDKESALFIACSCGHLEVALELCSRIDFIACNEIGASCLRIAASKGYTEIVRKIIGENPSLASRKDEKGVSALHVAASKGNLGVVNEFLEKDPILSFLRDNDGRTPLHLAMIYNQVHIVKEFLLERPKPTSFNSLLVTELINTADNNGDTILHLAAKIDCLEVIELLLSNTGMKVNTANNEGNTTVDILEQKQIPAHDRANDSNRGRMAIIKQLKARESASPISLTGNQLKLIAVAGLMMTLAFQAVLSPPRGLWQDSVGVNHTNHIPGKAIQSETNPGLFTVLIASDALGFLVSLALIPIIMILRKEMLFYVNSLVVLALISIEVVYILSETNPGFYSVFMAFNALGFFLALALILFITMLPKRLYVNSLVILALISIEVTFILSLIMIFEWIRRLYLLAEAELGRGWLGPWPIQDM